MQEARVPLMCEVVILTALAVEYKAISEHLQDVQEVTHQGTIYEYGKFIGQHQIWRIAVAEIGMGGITAATETERAISYFRPQITLFVGVGGGLKDVKLGDVVVASKVYAYESGKIAQQFQSRPEVWRGSYALVQRARAEARNDRWLTHLRDSCPDPIPQVRIGALAAGEKVLASTQSDLFHLLKETYGDTLAIEMEGHGFLAAVHANHSVHSLVIRGISDLIDDKTTTDAAGTQHLAAQHAAAFAFQVLATFTLPASDDTSSLLPGVWNVPYLRNPYFTGRDELFLQLEQRLSSVEQDHLTTDKAESIRPLAIKGLGGIGKTQIAVEYAYRSREQGRYTHMLWVNAADKEVMLANFIGLAEQLPAFPERGETNQSKLIAAIKRWLERCKQRWLLIFDNVDDISLIHEYLPQWGNGSILLTTRADAVGVLATSLEVEKMGLIEGTQFLLRRAQREKALDEESNEATNVVITLDCFPLALDQAGAYIDETKCRFRDYLQSYQEHRRALLMRRGEQATNYPDSVATTWSLSFQKVKQANPAAVELLRLCAFLAPDHIPEELLKDGATYWPTVLQKAASDLTTFDQMIRDLLRFSLVRRLAEERMLIIHRLVQAVQIEITEWEEQRWWAERVVRAMNKVFPRNPKEPVTWPLCLRYLDQTQTCKWLIGHYALMFAEAADLLSRTGAYLHRRSLYTVAEPLYQLALTINEQTLGAEHPEIAASLNNLGELYRAQGKYEEAESFQQRAMMIREQELGNSLNNLAVLYMDQGKYEQAEPLFKHVLANRELLLGTDHPETAKSLHNLALLYWRQGKHEQAELLLERTLAIQELHLGAVNPDLANNLNNLGILYWQQGKYKQAELLFQRTLAIQELHLGTQHRETAGTLNNLGILYRQQGEYEQAEPLFQRALAIQELHLGAEHPETAGSVNNLANLYRQQGKYEQAEQLFQRALAALEQRLGTEHPEVAKSLNNLALLYMDMGKHEQAESLFQRALAIREKHFGTEHSSTAYSIHGLAELYHTQRKYEQAEALYRRALSIREQQPGPEHPDTATTLENLANLYKDQGAYAKAEPLYQRALTICQRALGQKHPNTLKVRTNYALLLHTTGRDEEAKKLEEHR